MSHPAPPEEDELPEPRPVEPLLVPEELEADEEVGPAEEAKEPEEDAEELAWLRPEVEAEEVDVGGAEPEADPDEEPVALRVGPAPVELLPMIDESLPVEGVRRPPEVLEVEVPALVALPLVDLGLVAWQPTKAISRQPTHFIVGSKVVKHHARSQRQSDLPNVVSPGAAALNDSKWSTGTRSF